MTTKQSTFDVLTSSESNEWYSPGDIVAASRFVLGGKIDLDPASSYEANQTVKADVYYTKEADGMKQPWFGCVFLNPPYGRKTADNYGASAWIERAITKFETYAIDAAIIVCRGDSKGVKLLTERFLWCDAGRIAFRNPDKASDKPVPGTRIYYLGDEHIKFYTAFKDFGTIVKPYVAL